MPKDTLLHKSAYKGDVVGIEVALDEKHIDINAPGAQKRTALMRASGANHVGIVELLLGRGANPKQIDASGRSPLHWAAASSAYNAAQILCEKELDFNSKTKSGSAAIHLVAENGHVLFLKLLLTKEIILNEPDGEGKTPYQLAKENGHKSAAILLKPEGEGCCQIL